MGTKGREMVGMNVDELIALLNKALADEWLAYYQYWVGAKVVKGPMRPGVVAELLEHAGDELKHAEMLAERIAQLGGVPVLDPAEWMKESNCGYLKPEDFSVAAIVKQGIEGERCAIEVYRHLMKLTKETDEITYHMLMSILEDEIDHEDDFETILEDMGA